jgi:hypothetical protein
MLTSARPFHVWFDFGDFDPRVLLECQDRITNGLDGVKVLKISYTVHASMRLGIPVIWNSSNLSSDIVQSMQGKIPAYQVFLTVSDDVMDLQLKQLTRCFANQLVYPSEQASRLLRAVSHRIVPCPPVHM